MNARLFPAALIGALIALPAMAATFVAPADPVPAGPAPAAAAHAVAIMPLKSAALPPAGQPSAPTLRLEGAAAHWDFLPARQTLASRHAALPPALARN